jgi:hypothetical protein
MARRFWVASVIGGDHRGRLTPTPLAPEPTARNRSRRPAKVVCWSENEFSSRHWVMIVSTGSDSLDRERRSPGQGRTQRSEVRGKRGTDFPPVSAIACHCSLKTYRDAPCSRRRTGPAAERPPGSPLARGPPTTPLRPSRTPRHQMPAETSAIPDETETVCSVASRVGSSPRSRVTRSSASPSHSAERMVTISISERSSGRIGLF